MKLLFILLPILMLNKECEQTKSSDSSTAIHSEKTSDVMQENTTISYQATTRGFYEKIWVTKDSLTVTNDRNQTEKISYAMQKADWDELMSLLKAVDITTLPEIEAPTSMRDYDGAAFATLSVTQDTLETTSNSFDHGHPPKSIEALVNKVLSMRKAYQKN